MVDAGDYRLPRIQLRLDHINIVAPTPDSLSESTTRGLAAHAPASVLGALGVRIDPRDGRFVVPSESTIRRTLQACDGDLLDAVLGAWLYPRLPAEQVIVDGKTLRGARAGDGRAVHVLAAATTSNTHSPCSASPDFAGALAVPWSWPCSRGFSSGQKSAIVARTVYSSLAVNTRSKVVADPPYGHCTCRSTTRRQ